MSIASQGTLLKIESSTPSTYTTIGEVTQITGPGKSYTILDVTSLADSRRRKALGLLDPGSVTVELHLNYGDSGQDRVRTQEAAKALALWKIEIPAGALGAGSSSSATTLSFSGYVSSYSVSAALDGIYRMSITITLDTDITET